jgi:hypothetical protein
MPGLSHCHEEQEVPATPHQISLFQEILVAVEYQFTELAVSSSRPAPVDKFYNHKICDLRSGFGRSLPVPRRLVFVLTLLGFDER